MNKIQLSKLKKSLTRALYDQPVSFAYVYGSRLTGKIHQDSDLDIALVFSGVDETNDEELLLEALKAINKELAVPTEKLDVQNFKRLPLTVKFRVIRDGLPLYIKDLKIHRELISKTLSEYYDEKPFFQEATKAFLKRSALQYDKN